MRNQKGFTLIELMIAIAIVGILTAIAVPNFIAYRDKSYCSVAETDANSVAAALADYFALPVRTQIPELGKDPGQLYVNTRNSLANISVAREESGNLTAIVITVPDGSGRCPAKYRERMAVNRSDFKDGWDGNNYVKFSVTGS